MKIENPIGWTDETTNAVTGCEKVSEGCRFCYAQVGTRARVLRSQGIETWGPKGVRHPVNFEPVFRRLNKLCVCDKCHTGTGIEFIGGDCIYQPNHANGDPSNCDGAFRSIRLFADSNSDWLDEKWTVETLEKFLDAIRLAPNVDVILLTKRPENFIDRIGRVAAGNLNSPLLNWCRDWLNGKPPQNVWLGVSVENQAMADKRIPILLSIPASVRFLSAEPLLESVDLSKWIHWTHTKDDDGIKDSQAESEIDWVIVGGESGQHRRDCGVEAINALAEQCSTAEIPVFVKQDTSLFSGAQGRIPDNIFNLKQFPNLTKDTRSWWAARQNEGAILL